MRSTVKQLTTGSDNRQRNTTRSRNAADSLHIGPAEDGDPLASLICKGQAVQTDPSKRRAVHSGTQRHILEDLNTYTRAHFNIHFVLHQRLLRHRTVSHGIPRSTGMECTAQMSGELRSTFIGHRTDALLSHRKNSGVV